MVESLSSSRSSSCSSMVLGLRARHHLGRAQAERRDAGPDRRQPRRHRGHHASSGCCTRWPTSLKLLTKEDVVPTPAPTGCCTCWRPCDRRGPGDRHLRRHPLRRPVYDSSGDRDGQVAWSSRTSTGACSTSSRSARSPPTASSWPAGPATTTGRCSAGARLGPDDLLRGHHGALGRGPLHGLRHPQADRHGGIAQDTTFRLFGFIEHCSAGGTLHRPGSTGSAAALGRLPPAPRLPVFLTCIMAENKRPPFDLPEAESELIAGYFLEYSGMRFGLFYMAEFIEVMVIAGPGGRRSSSAAGRCRGLSQS